MTDDTPILKGLVAVTTGPCHFLFDFREPPERSHRGPIA